MDAFITALLTPEMMEKGAIAIICIVILIVGYKLFQLFLQQWQNSTESINKNTEAFMELSNFFKNANEREEAFQRQIMSELRDGVDVAKDTNKRVREIQRNINS